MSFVNRRLYKQKPQAWGPVSSVQASIFKNAERAGFSCPLIFLPHWEKSGSSLVNYGTTGFNGVIPSNFSWGNSGLVCPGGSVVFPFGNGLPSFIAGLDGVSAFWRGNITDTSSRRFIYLMITASGGSTTFFRLEVDASDKLTVAARDTAVATQQFITSSSSVVMGEDVSFCGVADIAGDYLYGYQNGSLIVSGSKSFTQTAFEEDASAGSYYLSTASGSTMQGVADLFAMFPHCLSAGQIAYLSDNPYFLLQRVQPVFYSVPGGGILPTFNPLFLNAAQPTRVIQ